MKIDEALANYRTLVTKVDGLCRRIGEEFSGGIACREGCSGCCRHLTLSPVEAYAIAAALAALPGPAAEELRARGRRADPDGPCPLLVDDRCALYLQRPLICRTHGLPLLSGEGDDVSIDFCPMNFPGVETFPGSAVINVETLNTLLDAVNRLFMQQHLQEGLHGSRISIAEALLIDIDEPGGLK